MESIVSPYSKNVFQKPSESGLVPIGQERLGPVVECGLGQLDQLGLSLVQGASMEGLDDTLEIRDDKGIEEVIDLRVFQLKYIQCEEHRIWMYVKDEEYVQEQTDRF